MAHSYIAAKNSTKERLVAIPDSFLHIFMFLFNEVTKNKDFLNKKGKDICDHYDLELLEVHTSYIELIPEEISEDVELKAWYLSILHEVYLLLKSFGDSIDNNYLNEAPNLNIEFVRPIPLIMIKKLINDIFWVLDENKTSPSGEFKWFEEPL